LSDIHFVGEFPNKKGLQQTMSDDAELQRLMKAIASADDAAVLDLLTASPALAGATLKEGATRTAAGNSFTEIKHHVYTGDTALHVAAAAHRPEIVGKLISLGADVAARNRLGATPLHYATDGIPGSPRWNPVAQSATVACLIASGADPNAIDKNSVTPLHRAVRTRCAAAASALLDGGADPLRKNGNDSTPMMLATRQTGRGGSGSPEAKAQQAEIIRLLERYGATPWRNASSQSDHVPCRLQGALVEHVERVSGQDDRRSGSRQEYWRLSPVAKEDERQFRLELQLRLQRARGWGQKMPTPRHP